MEMIIFNLIYLMNINNNLALSSFDAPILRVNHIINHAEKAYKFKLFKKNIKFKRFNRGLTRFIINRRKYILRKKRTIFIFQTYHVGYWSKSYQLGEQLCRYYQMVNILSLSLTLPDVSFFVSVGKKSLEHSKPVSFNSAALSKKLVKKSVFFTHSFKFSLDLTKDGIYGLCFLADDTEFQQNHFRSFNAGLITIKSNFFYPTTSFNKTAALDTRILSELTFWASGSFLTSRVLNILKTMRQVLITLTLISCLK